MGKQYSKRLRDELFKHKTIFKNTGWLSLIKIAQLIMPFVALPHIITVVGAENYGQIVFIQAIILYFILFVNFGLDVSAVRDVSIARDNKEELNIIVSSVLGIKFVLLFISSVIFCVCLFVIPVFRTYKLLSIFAFLTCFSDVLFPIWFYQGIEKMKYLTYIRFASIAFYTISIFIFIKSVDDYVFVPLLQSLSNIIGALLSIFFLLKIEKIKLVRPKLRRMYTDFTDSIPFFLSSFSASASSGISKLVCGTFFSMHLVAAFDIAQKVSLLAITPMQMLNQAIYPHISKTKDKIFANKFLHVNIILSLTVASIIFLLAPLIISLVSNGRLEESVLLLRILSLYTFFGGVATYIGAPILVSFGHPKPFTSSVIISFVVLLLLYFFMYISGSLEYIFFAFILVIAEFVIFLYRFYFCYKYQIFNLPWKRN